MEQWQRQHVMNNLSELSDQTIFNWNVKAELLANNILCKADVKKLDSLQNLNGNSHASGYCYQLLIGRKDAYKVLLNTLLKYSQTGAAEILIRVPYELYSKPITYLGIPTPTDVFKDVEIEVNGKKFRLHEFFPSVNYRNMQQIFEDTLTEVEVYDLFVSKQKPFVLGNNTIPPEPPIYVPRFISNRIKLDESTFKANCPDVFVFKNSIERYRLSQIAKPHFTTSSDSQLTSITSRFIYMNDTEDWFDLKKSAKVPIHLINYEADQNIFLLEDTSTASDILRRFGSRQKCVYISEQDFVTQQLSEECGSSSVCICDTPGMGKTFLLANIARIMSAQGIGRMIAFIQLSKFCADYSTSLQNFESNHETALMSVLNYISPSNKNAGLLLKLVQANMLLLEIFFDGFDEIPSDNVPWMKQVLLSITTKFSQVRINITSRPHMRQDLEKSLGVVAYDILPFNHQNQVDFLVQFWSQNKATSENLSLQNYATSCLKKVNDSLSDNDKKITGIPLLCHLIAEVANYATKKRNKKIPLDLSELYQEFIKKKINLIAKNEKEFDTIMLAHIFYALKLLFPMNRFHEDSPFESFDNLKMISVVLKVGIIYQQSDETLEFMHRSFAEYISAGYFSTKFKNTEIIKSKKMNCNAKSILKLLMKFKIHLKHDWDRYEYLLGNYVLVSFLNVFLHKLIISKRLENEVIGFVNSISPNDYFSVMYACCLHNFHNIFVLLQNNLIDKPLRTLAIYMMLSVCIRKSTSQMFHSIAQCFTDSDIRDVHQDPELKSSGTLLQLAVSYLNYEVIEYLVDKVPIRNQNVLRICVEWSYGDDESSSVKRENILQLLLNKDPSLIHDDPNILANCNINLRFAKRLLELGAKLTARGNNDDNVVTKAAEYMSPNDFHQCAQLMLTDFKAEYLFLPKEKWINPLPAIFERATLLPETIDMLLNIPGIDMNMKDFYGDNLLFHAVRENKFDNLKELISRGLDHKARGKANGSLLHVAASCADEDMIQHLLSLKLDPNSRDDDKETPLHKAVNQDRLSVAVVQILVANGGNIKAKNFHYQTALHLSAQNYNDTSSSNKELIKYLVTMGLGVNQGDKYGNTPLHLCMKKDLMECLIEMGANLNVKNIWGQTPKQTTPAQLWKSS